MLKRSHMAINMCSQMIRQVFNKPPEQPDLIGRRKNCEIISQTARFQFFFFLFSAPIAVRQAHPFPV